METSKLCFESDVCVCVFVVVGVAGGGGLYLSHTCLLLFYPNCMNCFHVQILHDLVTSLFD